MRLGTLLSLSLAAAAACGGSPALHPSVPPSAPASADSTWVAREPAVCGEVRGRVLDQEGKRPTAGVYVMLDSASSWTTTDSLGHFRLPLPRAEGSTVLTKPAFLRLRRIGVNEIRVLLPSDFGYVVEVQMPRGGFHIDHLATIRIKSPGFCADAA